MGVGAISKKKINYEQPLTRIKKGSFRDPSFFVKNFYNPFKPQKNDHLWQAKEIVHFILKFHTISKLVRLIADTMLMHRAWKDNHMQKISGLGYEFIAYTRVQH